MVNTIIHCTKLSSMEDMYNRTGIADTKNATEEQTLGEEPAINC